MKAMVAVSKSREWVESEWEEQLGTHKIPSGWQVRYGKLRQFTASERHNVAANEAMWNYDRLLFMDTDQIYPPEYLEMMLAHTEPVVSALNVSRYYPFEMCIYKYEGELGDNGLRYPKFTAIMPPVEKLFEVDCVGTGALMIDTKVLKELEHPFFKDIYDSEGCLRHCPDDFYFMWQLAKKGIKVTVDQNIVVKHLSKLVVSPYNVRDYRKAWDKVNSGFGMWKDGKQA
jgi:hypothetical protein